MIKYSIGNRFVDILCGKMDVIINYFESCCIIILIVHFENQ